MARYKDKGFQKMYDGLLEMAADPSSSLYVNGKARGGAGHRCQFWHGAGVFKYPAPVSGTLGMVAFQAGKEWAKRMKKEGKELPESAQPKA